MTHKVQEITYLYSPPPHKEVTSEKLETLATSWSIKNYEKKLVMFY